jgi:drug/metabolite transporter (DMT)-like permease
MTTTTSNLHVDDGITHPAVRPFLLTDAALTTGNGLVYLLAAGWLADLFGAATSLLIGLGALLVVVGAAVAWLATRRPVPRTFVLELAAFNAVWVVASLGYAVGALWLKRQFKDVKPIGLVTATMSASALMTLPVAALTAPDAVPGLGPVAAVAALGILGTGISFVLFYDLIATIGPAKASLVAYVAPGFSIVYGVTLLDESFSAATAAGLVLILAGSWLAAEGRLPWRRRPPTARTPLRSHARA